MLFTLYGEGIADTKPALKRPHPKRRGAFRVRRPLGGLSVIAFKKWDGPA